MESRPLVSILLNCFNCSKYLKETLDSVYAQTYENWEIIFIDNCSQDNSKYILNDYDKKKIKYFKTPDHVSLCHARVFAKDFIKGEMFCVIDSDDLWLPTKLEKQINIMENNPQIGIVYTNTIYFSDFYKDKLAYDVKMPSGNIFKQLLENYFLSFETVMVRKTVMDAYNIYFDYKYGVISDAEFFIKLSYFTDAFYLDEPLAKWRYGHVSESDVNFFLFPKEWELLLIDLSQMINDFEKIYKDSLYFAKMRIDSMYGNSEWKKGNKKKARMYFIKALKKRKRYFIPWLLSFFLSHNSYVNIRRKIKKI